MIDWSKPIETVTGLPVTVISADNPESIIVTFEACPEEERFSEGPWRYNADGTVSNHFLPDLRNILEYPSNG